MNFHIINHKMWMARNGTLRNAIRDYGDGSALIAIYLITSPHANQSGVYYFPVDYIAAETDRSADEVETCLVNLERLGFCKYDYDAQVVWVIKMVIYQVQNWPGDKKDNRFKGVIRNLCSVPSSYLVDEFLEFWSLPSITSGTRSHHHNSTDSTEGSLSRGLQGASKGLGDAVEELQDFCPDIGEVAGGAS